jgi:hypothetical protein
MRILAHIVQIEEERKRARNNERIHVEFSTAFCNSELVQE